MYGSLSNTMYIGDKYNICCFPYDIGHLIFQLFFISVYIVCVLIFYYNKLTKN